MFDNGNFSTKLSRFKNFEQPAVVVIIDFGRSVSTANNQASVGTIKGDALKESSHKSECLIETKQCFGNNHDLINHY